MSKWDEIHKISTNALNTFNQVIDTKLRKDASVIVGDKWADIIRNTHLIQEEAKNYLDVDTDEKTGTLIAQVNLPLDHPDYLKNKSPLSNYVLDKFKEANKSLIEAIKNPYARQELQNRIIGHSQNLTHNLLQFESKIIMDKRKAMVVDNIEKGAKAIYNDPSQYELSLQDDFTAIDMLAVSSLERDNLKSKSLEIKTQAMIDYLLINNPQAILSNEPALWKENATYKQMSHAVKAATKNIQKISISRNRELRQITDKNITSILKTGDSIDGIENVIAITQGGVQQEQIRLNELAYDAHVILNNIIQAPRDKQLELTLEQEPDVDDPEYALRSHIYNELVKEVTRVNKLAYTDPASYADELSYNDKYEPKDNGELFSSRMQIQEQTAIPSYERKYLTNKERSVYLQKLTSQEPDIIHKTLEEISVIESGYDNLGYDILHELRKEASTKNNLNVPASVLLYMEGFIQDELYLMDIASKLIATDQPMTNASKEDLKYYKEQTDELLADFEHSVLKGNRTNVELVNTMKSTVIELAKWIKDTQRVDDKKALIKAKDIVMSQYLPVDTGRDDLYLPSYIRDNGEKIELNERAIETGLKQNKANLIRNFEALIPFQDEELTEDMLRRGEFVLLEDGKHVGFIFEDDNGLDNSGFLQYLIGNDGEKYKVSLLELNKTIFTGMDRELELETYHRLGVF